MNNEHTIFDYPGFRAVTMFSFRQPVASDATHHQLTCCSEWVVGRGGWWTSALALTLSENSYFFGVVILTN